MTGGVKYRNYVKCEAELARVEAERDALRAALERSVAAYDAAHPPHMFHDPEHVRIAREALRGVPFKAGNASERALNRAASQPPEHHCKFGLQFPNGKVYCEVCGTEIPRRADQTSAGHQK